MTAQELNSTFGIAGVLHFEEELSGLVRAQITTSAAEATIYLQGAHLTHWRPTGQPPVLFTSTQSPFEPGKSIRGGIPVVFPWFGRHSGPELPGQQYDMHGFARIVPWAVRSVSTNGDEIQLTFSLSANDQSRALGYAAFRLEYTFHIGHTLRAQFDVYNDAAEPLQFEEALHTYFSIEDIDKTTVEGLAGAKYLDSGDHFAVKVQEESLLRFVRHTDHIYLDTTATCIIHDAGNNRRISVEKSGSQTTVVWNPSREVAANLPGLLPADRRHFICVETANAHGNRLTLAPGAHHRLSANITVLPV
ncbi:MAG: D-hexose-6-phosphate mutarotase [Acidobacteriaceae bacterium]|nr:D-hexose-6-phosphate mutarotase [Acidobacteriaceae bacterium]